MTDSASRRLLAPLVLGLVFAVGAAAQAGQEKDSDLSEATGETLAALRAVSAALAEDDSLSPELRDSLLRLLSALERDRMAAVSRPDLEDAEILARLTRLRQRADQQERTLGPLAELADRLSISGDIRLRYEADRNRDDKPSRNRGRVRLRLAANLDVTDEVLVGTRLVTGDADDARSTHQTFGDVFDGLEVSLDRAFIEYQPERAPSLWGQAGKFAHPFRANPVFGELVWDTDVQPEGLAVGWGASDVIGLSQLDVVVGQYLVLEQADLDDSSAFVAQVSGRKNIGDDVSVFGAVGYYHYSNLTPDGSSAVTDENAGNALTPGGNFVSRYSIVNPIAAVTYLGFDRPLTVAAEYIDNTRAELGQGQGWSMGAAYGTTKAEGDWRSYYQFQDIEQDAVLSPFAQDDFLLTTGFRGHVAGWQYQLRDDVQVHLWSLVSQRRPSNSGSAPSERNHQWRVRLDLNVKF